MLPNPVKPELGYATFAGFGGPRSNGRIAYALFGLKCVFSAFKPDATSSINAAEGIILTLARQEGIDPSLFSFFDLQTHLTYHSKEPGEFEFDQVKFRYVRGAAWGFRREIIDGEEAEVLQPGPIQDLSWWPTVCPDEVIKLFARLIGPNPRQLRLAEAQPLK